MSNDRFEIITKKELLKIVPYSAFHIWRLERDDRFPARVKLGPNRVGWYRAEIVAWLEERSRDRKSTRWEITPTNEQPST